MYYVLDERGKEISHNWDSLLGDLLGFSGTFMVFRKNNTQLYTLLYKGFCIITDFSIIENKTKRATNLVARFCCRKFVLITKSSYFCSKQRNNQETKNFLFIYRTALSERYLLISFG